MSKPILRMLLAALTVCAACTALTASAQQYAGPLLPHVGGRVTTAFSNHFGPDAESTVTFTSVTPQAISIDYVSSRGLLSQRDIQASDQSTARKYVLGYAKNMPRVIPGSTSLGISTAVLEELRNTGHASLNLVYDADLNSIDGQLYLVERAKKVPIIVENKLMDVEAIKAEGKFGSGSRYGTATFVFLDNKSNPMLIDSNIKFSWEDRPREERIIQVTAGQSMKSAMEQSLSTLKRYDLYGLHFDFDKASLRPESAALLDDIALTLKSNPSWSLRIVGHTDSIGEPAYNQKLSNERAGAVVAALTKLGVAATRLEFSGAGEAEPKGDNGTLEGRALNRRVELIRTDK